MVRCWEPDLADFIQCSPFFNVCMSVWGGGEVPCSCLPRTDFCNHSPDQNAESFHPAHRRALFEAAPLSHTPAPPRPLATTNLFSISRAILRMFPKWNHTGWRPLRLTFDTKQNAVGSIPVAVCMTTFVPFWC